MLDASWTLHPQLAADATNVCDLSLSRVLAINAADYPWLILVPRRPGAVEIADLGDEASLLMREMTRASRALTDITRCDKLNVAAIGNVVPQLHVHNHCAVEIRSVVAEAGLGRVSCGSTQRHLRAVPRRSAEQA